ncbi:hypothetical protein [Actinokineospora iranica]|uniref:Uncharacterized protein n=1 Tax=Actinokineospora iranica TaxID=1271860 RepID=A0A1G6WKJ1_9PSEU|nr:hypothetical protein [Actinokineospora iranica]SDD66480.1 hypothetical protein SAMN05216174_11561 [Actinokineospora iranica]
MIDPNTLLDPLGWPRWLARDAERRRVVAPEVLARLDHAVRDFPAEAFAIGLLPDPLPIEHAEKLPRSDHRETTEGARVRHRVVAMPGEVRGWNLGRGVVISMGQTTVRPVYTPVARGESAGLRPGGVIVRAVISDWEPYPPPVEVEIDATRTVPLDVYLRRVLTDMAQRRH